MVMWLKKVQFKETIIICMVTAIVIGLLELINNMLTSGMVAALFANDEIIG